jgi:hypothetical protein
MKLMPTREPKNNTTFLGPNLSVNVPAKIPSRPSTAEVSERAPETVALVQPNSPSMDLKKTP